MNTSTGAIAVDREVVAKARPQTIFRYFTDPARFADWFGPGSTIDPRPGGTVEVRFPTGDVALGEVVELVADERIVFTWGYPGDDSPLPLGASQVEIVLEPEGDGTRVRLTHRVPSDEMRQAHESGWTYHLNHLATMAARDDGHVHSSDAVRAALQVHLWASELPRAVDWYRETLGFEIEARYPADEPSFFILRRDQVAVMLGRVPAPEAIAPNQTYMHEVRDRMGHGGPVAFYLVVDDVDAAHDLALEVGAEVIEEIWDPWWGGRQFTLRGPDDVWWTVTSGS